MSIDRVFETARKLGLAVILTDAAGREPMVVIPLELFESLVTSVQSEVAPTSHIKSSGDAPEYESLATSLAKDFESTLAARKAGIKSIAQSASSLSQARSEQVLADPGLSLEERFYIEPVEDETTV